MNSRFAMTQSPSDLPPRSNLISTILNLSEKLDIDLMAASWAKLKANGEKYPVDKAKGSMKKYTEL